VERRGFILFELTKIYGNKKNFNAKSAKGLITLLANQKKLSRRSWN